MNDYLKGENSKYALNLPPAPNYCNFKAILKCDDANKEADLGNIQIYALINGARIYLGKGISQNDKTVTGTSTLLKTGQYTFYFNVGGVNYTKQQYVSVPNTNIVINSFPLCVDKP